MLNLATRFINYCNKVYALDQRLSQVKDGRKKAQYSLPSLLMKMISGIVTGIRSFNQLEETVNHGIFDGIGGIGKQDIPNGTFFHRMCHLVISEGQLVRSHFVTSKRTGRHYFFKLRHSLYSVYQQRGSTLIIIKRRINPDFASAVGWSS
jgi:hypothetical protein